MCKLVYFASEAAHSVRLAAYGMDKAHKSPFRFSRVWEDHRLVSAALDVQPEEDVVLCITRYNLYTSTAVTCLQQCMLQFAYPLPVTVSD